MRLGIPVFMSNFLSKHFVMSSFVLLVFMTSIVLIIYQKSEYNVHFFKMMNLLFFLTFILSFLSFFLDIHYKERETHHRNQIYCLQQLYDTESSHVPNNFQVIYTLQLFFTYQEIDLLEHYQKRLSRLVQRPPFQHFWRQNQWTYPRDFQHLVNSIISSS